MTDEEALLAAIRANPDEDAPRLAYADWLDENSRPGAGFLRTEHELGATPVGLAIWHDAFARHQRAPAGLPSEWCMSVRRYPLAHWLAMSARCAWTRLENWFRQNYPRLLDDLADGVSAEEISAIEWVIGQSLPADVRESLAIHNGAPSFVLGDDLLSTQLIASEWQFWRGFESYNEEFRDGMTSHPEEAVALDYANPGWVPLTKAGGMDYLGVDLAPGPGGVRGQVINFGRDENKKCVLASGWAEFLADFATFLESGASGWNEFRANLPVRSGAQPEIEPEQFFDCCLAAFGKHCHDGLREWRVDGRWPPRQARPGNL